MTEPNPTIDLAKARAALNNQQQCDDDGVMCIVSRQALHEILADYDALLTALEQMQAALYHNPPFVPSPEPEGRTDDDVIAAMGV